MSEIKSMTPQRRRIRQITYIAGAAYLFIGACALLWGDGLPTAMLAGGMAFVAYALGRLDEVAA